MSMVRLKDVAEKAGVSLGAVGRVLNGTGASSISVGEKTAARIQKVADELGYRPNLAARQLRYGKSNIIGIITHEAASDEDFRRIVSIERSAAKMGLHVMVTMLDERGELDVQLKEAVAGFHDRGVDGVIALWWALLKADNKLFGKMPVVFIGPEELMRSRKGVEINSFEGGRLAAEHLIERGCRRIGFVLERHEFADGRLRGAKEVLSAHRLRMNKNWIIRSTADHFGNDVFAEQAAVELLDKQKVDAIIAENDHWAAWLYKAVLRRGLKIPDDVAIIGYNNQKFCDYMEPPLTSFEEREDEIAQNLLTIFSGKSKSEMTMVVNPQLVVRKST